MKQSHRVAKNMVFGALSAVLGGLLNFASIFIVARYLGVADFGVFSYLLAFASVFQFMADFGLTVILVRDMAREPEHMPRIMGSAKLLVWFLFAVATLAMLLCLQVLHLDLRMKLLSFVMGVGYLVLIHTVTYVAALRATEAMEYNAIGFVLQKALLVAFLIVALWMQWGLWGVVWCHFTSNLLLWGYYHWITTRRIAGARMHFNWSMWKALIWETLPMGGGVALRQLTWRMDVFLLTYFTTPLAVGLFSGPFQIIIGLTILPGVFAVPLFPLYVRLARESHTELVVLYQRSIKWFSLMGFPIVVAFLTVPLPWIHFFLGARYDAAAPVLQILSIAIIPVFLSILYPFLYGALNIQKWFMITMAVAMVSRLVFGALVIPHYGFLGQAVVIDAVELGIFFTLSGHLSRMGLPAGVGPNLLKPLLASAVMGLFLYFVGNDQIVWTAFATVVGSVIYLVALWLLGTFTPEEVAMARDASGFLSNSVVTRFFKRGVQV